MAPPLNAGLAYGLGQAFIAASSVASGAASLVEGACLKGFQALNKIEAPSTCEKIVKCALAALAVLGAIATTGFAGLAGFVIAALFTSSLPLALVGGGVLAAVSLVAHKAMFQWAGVIGQPQEQSTT